MKFYGLRNKKTKEPLGVDVHYNLTWKRLHYTMIYGGQPYVVPEKDRVLLTNFLSYMKSRTELNGSSSTYPDYGDFEYDDVEVFELAILEQKVKE